MTDSLRFDINLSGLVRTLSESLYSRPEIAVRELVQNAVDSCTRRRAQDNDCPDQLEVWIQTSPKKRELIVRDIGAGLNRNEIVRDLATIGTGGTRRLRKELEAVGNPLARELIGQFGVGFLSAFMLGERVTVETRSFRDDYGRGWQFVAQGDQAYQLRPIERTAVGSIVTLEMKPEFEDILDPKRLRSVLRHYSALLPVPIYVGRRKQLMNASRPPWRGQSSESQYRRFVMERIGRDVLEVIPVNIHDGKIEVQGVLAMPDSVDLFTNTEYDFEVYIRHMYIGREHSLLPPWARCSVGIIDTPSLSPTASREAVVQDEAFRRVRALLGKSIIGHLRHLANKAPDRLGRVMGVHHLSLKAWAIADEELLEALGDHLPVRTNMGALPLRACVEAALGLPPSPDRGRPTLLYRTRGQNNLVDRLIMGQGNRLVIDATSYPDADLLRAYRRVAPKVDIRDITELDPVWFGDEDARAGSRRLVAWYETRGIPTRVSALGAAEAPAVYLGKSSQDTDEWDEANETHILVLNSKNPAIARLIAAPSLEPHAMALELLEHQAYIAAAPRPDTERLRATYDTLTNVLVELISKERPS